MLCDPKKLHLGPCGAAPTYCVFNKKCNKDHAHIGTCGASDCWLRQYFNLHNICDRDKIHSKPCGAKDCVFFKNSSSNNQKFNAHGSQNALKNFLFGNQ
jgi:hypothetical protein